MKARLSKMDRLWNWSAISSTPIPSLPISELSSASKDYATQNSPARELSREEKEEPATKGQCQMIYEHVWRHEFLLQGLLTHVEQLQKTQTNARASSELALSASSEPIRKQLDAIEFRQSQQDIVLNELSKMLHISNRCEEQERRLNALSENMQQHSLRHEEHRSRFEALSNALDEKHAAADSQHREALSASSEKLNQHALAHHQHAQRLEDLTLRLESLSKQVGTETGSQVKNSKMVHEETEYFAWEKLAMEPEEIGAPEATQAERPKEKKLTKATRDSTSSASYSSTDELDMVVSAYTLQESVWDVVVFAGFPSVGPIMSLMIMIAAIANLFLQMLFSLIITVNMTHNDFTDNVVDGFKVWRRTDGHEAFTSNFRQPLAAQICGNNLGGMSLSTTQFLFHNDIRSFLGTKHSELLSGRVSAILCVLVWFFAVMKDVLHLVKYAVSLMSLKRGAPRIGIHSDASLEITSLSHLQLGLVLTFSVIPRFCVCVLLAVSGILFLGYTRQLHELLLNAVALVFVLDLDELLYVVLVPRRVKLIQEHVKTLAKSSDHHRLNQFLGGALFVCTWIALSVIVLVVAHFYHLQPFHERLLKVDKYLCNGNLNFEYVINKATGVVMYTETSAWPQDFTEENSYQTVAVVGLADIGDLDSQGPQPRATPVQVSILQMYLEHQRSGEESVNALSCEDQATRDMQHRRPEWFNAYIDVLRWEIDDFDLNYCEDVPAGACQRYGMEVARAQAICMVTCGCDDPWSGLIVQNGCSKKCTHSFERKLNSTSTAPPSIREYVASCSDPPTSLLVQEPQWQDYARNMEIITAERFGPTQAAEAARLLLTQGCEGASQIQSDPRPFLNLCYPPNDISVRSIRMWCPATCQCKAETCRQAIAHRQECPQACHENHPCR